MRRATASKAGAPALLLTALMLAASAAAAAAQGLPPIITVKNVRTHVGPTYKWDVRSTVLGAPAVEQLYPGTTASAKVALAVTRTKAGRGFLVTGKVLVTNPRPNAAPLDVKQVKVAWGPVIPLLTPSPTQLDCEARLLAPGKSMSCSFRTEASTGIIKTMTPQVLIAGLPLMQGQPVPIEWSTDAEPAPGSRAAQDTSGCALISSQVVAGELLQPGVRVSAAKDQADLLTTGVEVCGDSASFTYNIVMGPFTEDEKLCGTHQIRDAPEVRLASGSPGSSSTTPITLPVTIGGCRRKDILGGNKPSLQLGNLTVAKLVAHEWSAHAVATTNTSSPARARVNGSHTVNVTVELRKTAHAAETELRGELTLTNTEKLPYVLPEQGVRVVLVQAGSTEKLFATAACPLVAGTIVVGAQVKDTPGTLACSFAAPLPSGWSKGTIQAQLQTLLSATHDVDSGAPRPVDIATLKVADTTAQGDCVHISLARVTKPADLAAANSNGAVAALAKSLGADSFKLLPKAARPTGGRMPPPASDSAAEPLAVCDSSKVAWQETYGPFGDLDCGAGMVLTGVTAQPTTDAAAAATATLAFPIAVSGCAITPDISLVAMNAKVTEGHEWKAQQTAAPASGARVAHSEVKEVAYNVAFTRAPVRSGRKVQGVVKVFNRHAAELVLDRVQFAISRPAGVPAITGDAPCSTTAPDAEALTGAVAAQPAGEQWTDLLPGREAQPAAAKDALPPTYKLAAAAAVSTAAASGEAGGSSSAQAQAQGPLFCTFAAELPDDYAGSVTISATTNQGATATQRVGALDWSTAKVTPLNQCAMASFDFNGATHLMQPSKVAGPAPPKLAERICEPKSYQFTASFGSWKPSQCGLKQALGVATLSLPGSRDLVTDEQALHLEVVGCPSPLPVLQVDATQARVKAAYDWTIERQMQPVGTHVTGVAASVAATAAGTRQPMPAPAVLTLPAVQEPAAVPGPGAYASFVQTIMLKRSEPVEQHNKFEVKGEIRLANNGNMPLQLTDLEVRIKPEGKDADAAPVVVKAQCPARFYRRDDETGETVLELPATEDRAPTVRCSYGAMVSGPGTVAVTAAATTFDGRKAPSQGKAVLHLDAKDDKPVTLGSCLRVNELQVVRDALTGNEAAGPVIKGSRIPEDGTYVCSSTTFSFVGRVGPLSQALGCQALTYSSAIEGAATSGYQPRLRNEGVVEVQTPSCKQL